METTHPQHAQSLTISWDCGTVSPLPSFTISRLILGLWDCVSIPPFTLSRLIMGLWDCVSTPLLLLFLILGLWDYVSTPLLYSF